MSYEHRPGCLGTGERHELRSFFINPPQLANQRLIVILYI